MSSNLEVRPEPLQLSKIESFTTIDMMLCTIWYQLHNLKNVKITYGGVLLLVRLQGQILQLY